MTWPCIFTGLLLLATTCADASQSPSLQEMVAAAAPGATVIVPAGTYYGPLTIERPLTLIASGDVVIQGPGEGDVVTITAPDVTLRGFHICGTGKSLDRENAGIVVTAPRATIEANSLADVLFGVYLKESPHSVIRGNQVLSKPLPEPRRGDAIRLWESSHSLIEGNVVHGSRDVIVWFSEEVLLRGNRVTGGRYGMHFMYSSDATLEDNVLTDNSVGTFLMYSRNLTLRRNILARNRGPSGFGVGLKDMDGLVAEDNIMVGNRVGIHLDNSPSEVNVVHHVRRNVIAYNDVGVGFLPSVTRNQFSENSFFDNVEQVAVLGSGRLRGNNFVVEGRGNFWSDYQGFDLDGDGVGETPYRSQAFFENLVDRNPRMRLFLYSPAQHALEMAARAFPVVAPRPKIEDPAPLLAMVKPQTSAEQSSLAQSGVDRSSCALAAMALLGVGLVCMGPAVSIAQWRLTATLRREEGEQHD
ncbi:MAG: nitrous oxide reductase family maturation protein NosD [Planctomycetales bacterium]|nr:nitrous oxide reductase family maturation protein NosD [Planctomycetales bacterium]